MAKNKKVFSEAVAEMKHFLLGAALVLTLVAVVPVLAQDFGGGGGGAPAPIGGGGGGGAALPPAGGQGGQQPSGGGQPGGQPAGGGQQPVDSGKQPNSGADLNRRGPEIKDKGDVRQGEDSEDFGLGQGGKGKSIGRGQGQGKGLESAPGQTGKFPQKGEGLDAGQGSRGEDEGQGSRFGRKGGKEMPSRLEGEESEEGAAGKFRRGKEALESGGKEAFEKFGKESFGKEGMGEEAAKRFSEAQSQFNFKDLKKSGFESNFGLEKFIPKKATKLDIPEIDTSDTETEQLDALEETLGKLARVKSKKKVRNSAVAIAIQLERFCQSEELACGILDELADVLRNRRASRDQILEAMQAVFEDVREAFESGGEVSEEEEPEEEFEEEFDIPDGGF